jgi:hypothetical protein
MSWEAIGRAFESEPNKLEAAQKPHWQLGAALEHLAAAE